MAKEKITKKRNGAEDDAFAPYARAIQKDLAVLGRRMREGFASIHSEMATQDDIRKIREEMATKAEIREVREDVQRITHMMVSKADLSEAIRDEFNQSDHGKRIDRLSDRVDRIEERLRLKPARRA